MNTSLLPNYKHLHQLFTYDPQSGALLRNGKPTGYITARGYRLLSVRRYHFYAHRAIWCMMTGSWPAFEIDHINRQKADNRWSNLRLATRSQNARNTALTKRNKSGYRGVCFNKRIKRWAASIKLPAQKWVTHLGHYETPEAAAQAYAEVARRNFGEFACV